MKVLRLEFVILVVSLCCCLIFSTCSSAESSSVLVFSKTMGYRHSSIAAGQELFFQLGKIHHLSIDTTEDASLFTVSALKKYDLIVFLNTTGDVLNEAQQSSLENYMAAGGSWLGIHAAADTEYDWPWYNELVGAYFENHPNDPNVRTADLRVKNNEHPATAHLEPVWSRSDEWYNYRDIRTFETLIELDEATYEGGTNGSFHPMSWYRSVHGGRMFYTGMGHTEATYEEPAFQEMIWGAIRYLLDKNVDSKEA